MGKEDGQRKEEGGGKSGPRKELKRQRRLAQEASRLIGERGTSEEQARGGIRKAR